jgi:hypothetical protein
MQFRDKKPTYRFLLQRTAVHGETNAYRVIIKRSAGRRQNVLHCPANVKAPPITTITSSRIITFRRSTVASSLTRDGLPDGITFNN